MASILLLCRATIPKFLQARQALTKEKELDRAVLDKLPIHFCILDETATVIAVNHAWRAFAEANPPVRSNVNEGANYLKVCEAAKNDPIAAKVATALRALIEARLTEFYVEYPCHSPTEERWFSMRAARYLHAEKVRIVIAHETITERVLAERAVKQGEDRYRTIVEQALDALYVFDREGRIEFVNSATCILTGYSRNELIGLPIIKLLRDEDHSRFAATKHKLFSGEVDQAEWCVVRKDGSHVDVEVRARLQSDGNVVGFARDVTARNEAEALRQERDAAEEANRAKDQFLAMLSHELRTPLAPVLMATRMIEQDPELPDHVRDLAATIYRNIEIQARLIDDLLDQTRIARGKIELHQKRVNLHELIDHVRKILHEEFSSKNLEIRVVPQATNGMVKGDAARLQQILWNILKNAVKFTPPEGSITIRTRNPDTNHVRVEITDSGIGIEPDELSRLFHPFEQGNINITRRFDGLGLGLAISQKLAELHGGTLSARSEGKNRGATFILELPTVAGQRGEIAAPAQEAAKSARRLRILLVEDHPDTARILARLLERRGHHVHICNTMHDAEEIADHEPFDLVLSDLNLPDGSGHDLMAFLRATHPIPGIAMSGFGMEQDVSKSREAGFAKHLVKPVDPARLEEAIEEVVANGR